jgi:hypothetical protein
MHFVAEHGLERGLGADDDACIVDDRDPPALIAISGAGAPAMAATASAVRRMPS